VKKEDTPKQQQSQQQQQQQQQQQPQQPQQHQPSLSGLDPAKSTSKIDINAIPIYKPTGKPLTQLSIDEDLPENDKPWRRAGTDLTDYFNYGFDEYTWTLYADKQQQLRKDYDPKTVMDQWTALMPGMLPGMMPGMPGMPSAPAAVVAPTAPAAAAGGMPGMDGGGIPPDMQAAMMQHMMQQGMDPSQMDPNTMMAMMQQMGGQAAQGGQGQGQNFQQGYGGGQQGYGGYDQQQQGGRGNFGGRGRGGRRQW
jgi:pre-mRNA 3'-end-processing factor FIP1